MHFNKTLYTYVTVKVRGAVRFWQQSISKNKITLATRYFSVENGWLQYIQILITVSSTDTSCTVNRLSNYLFGLLGLISQSCIGSIWAVTQYEYILGTNFKSGLAICSVYWHLQMRTIGITWEGWLCELGPGELLWLYSYNRIPRNVAK